MTDEADMVERVARAMWESSHDGEWPRDAEDSRHIYIGDAYAALAAMAERRSAQDDAGIEQAAIALAYVSRPVLSAGPIMGIPPDEWWRLLSERERRLYSIRARAACAAWEQYWAAIETAGQKESGNAS